MKKSILIIEHDDLIRGLLEEWLGAAGYSTRHARACDSDSGEAADLVITDIFMPKLGCQGALTKIKIAHPKAKIIAISAQFRSGLGCSTEVARQLNVFRALSKPFSRTDLLDAVEAAIGSVESGLSAAS
jgi:DNA-binding NtrC family response regulator